MSILWGGQDMKRVAVYTALLSCCIAIHSAELEKNDHIAQKDFIAVVARLSRMEEKVEELEDTTETHESEHKFFYEQIQYLAAEVERIKKNQKKKKRKMITEGYDSDLNESNDHNLNEAVLCLSHQHAKLRKIANLLPTLKEADEPYQQRLNDAVTEQTEAIKKITQCVSSLCEKKRITSTEICNPLQHTIATLASDISLPQPLHVHTPSIVVASKRGLRNLSLDDAVKLSQKVGL